MADEPHHGDREGSRRRRPPDYRSQGVQMLARAAWTCLLKRSSFGMLVGDKPYDLPWPPPRPYQPHKMQATARHLFLDQDHLHVPSPALPKAETTSVLSLRKSQNPLLCWIFCRAMRHSTTDKTSHQAEVPLYIDQDMGRCRTTCRPINRSISAGAESQCQPFTCRGPHSSAGKSCFQGGASNLSLLCLRPRDLVLKCLCGFR